MNSAPQTPHATTWPGALRATVRSGRMTGPARSAALLVVVVVVFTVMSPSFATTFNVRSVLAFAVPALLVTVGQTLVIALGEIDLSVAAVAALSGIVFILVQPEGLALALLAAAAVGVAAGLFNSLAVTLLNVPSLVSTLATLFIAQGFALLFAREPVTGSRLDLTRALSRTFLGVLTPRIVIGLVVVVLSGLALSKTAWGRQLYARGSDRVTARRLGVPGGRLVVSAFLLCGLLSAAAGVITAIGLNGASPVVGTSLLLLSIAACLIGGSRLEGGTGSVVGSSLALLMLLALQNGMDQIGVSAFVQMVIRGFVVLIAVLAVGGGPVGGMRLEAFLRRPSTRRPPSSEENSDESTNDMTISPTTKFTTEKGAER